MIANCTTMPGGLDALRSAARLGGAWLALPMGFSLAYALGFGHSNAGAAAHLALSAVVLVPCAMSVLLVMTFISSETGSKALGGFATGCVFSVQAFIYALLLLGLASWGRVPTLSLIAGYAHQIRPTLEALGISPLGAIASISLATLLAAALNAYWVRNDWVMLARYIRSAGGRRPRWKPRLLTLALILCGAAGSARLWSDWVFHTDGSTSDEPWYLVFETVPAGHASAQSLVFDRIGDQRRRIVESDIAKSYQPTRSLRQKNVVLITVDALRPDHMSAYGYSRRTTPYLDSLAASGRLKAIHEARSACPESSCGLLSLLTGKQPHELLSSNFGLMEILERHGYRRTLVLSGDHTNFYRLRDFYGKPDHYEDGASSRDRYANDDFALIERLRRLPEAAIGQPQFIFLHLMSVHGLGIRHPEFQRWLPASSIYNLVGTLGTEGLQRAVNFYDNGVLQADFMIREALEILRSKGYVENDSLILVTADHAESLGQHGIRTHAQSLFDSVLRIPWLWIGASPSMPDAGLHIVQADFAPTVLTELGIPVPPNMSGIPMQRGIDSRMTFHAQPPEAGIIRSTRQSRHKLIHDFSTGKSLWVDLRADPMETARSAPPPEDHVARGLFEQLIRTGYGQFAGSGPGR